MKTLPHYDTCALCPNLCRHVCPVAVGSAREAATPTAKMTGPYLFLLGAMPARQAGLHAALCVNCGACTEHCLLERPVGELLADARGELLEPIEAEPPGPVEGKGRLVAVECDERPWAEALARRLDQPVARLRTSDHLGEATADHPRAFAAHAALLRRTMADRTAVVACLGCLRAAEAAGLQVQHLSELAPMEWSGPVHAPCGGPTLDGPLVPDALRCCGAAAPLPQVHPQVAREVAAEAARRLGDREIASPDCRCGRTLRTHGARVIDVVTMLLET